MSYILPDRWFREKDGKQIGPYTIPELYRFLEAGEASPDERVQADSGAEWLTISEVLRRSRGDLAASASPSPPRATARLGNIKPAKAPAGNYIALHWRGDLSLGFSYWVNAVLLPTLLSISFMAVAEANIFEGMSYYYTAALLTTIVVLSLIFVVWVIVGTWRSSERHVSRGGRLFWAITVKFLLIIAGSRAGLEYITSEIPTVINAWRHAATMSEMPPAEFRALRGGTEIEFSGGIHADTAGRLETLLSQNPRVRVIHLNSNGGDLAGGHAMAAIIRSRGLDTYVRSECVSACAAAFLAGRNRLLRDGAKLGFHAPTVVAGGLTGEQAVANERRKLAEAGLPDWFVARAFSVRGEAVWFPTPDELLSARAITDTTDGRHLSPGRPNPPTTVAQAERNIRAMPLGAALERFDPSVFRETVQAIREGINDGWTEDEIAREVDRQVTPIYTRALPVLPDRQMVAIQRVIMETARQLSASDPRVCRNWLMHRPGQPVPLIGRHITREQNAALVQAMADAITTAADPRQRATTPREAPPQLDNVINRLDARLPPGHMRLFENIDSPSHPPNVVCSLVIELYTEILRLPEREAGPLLRFMLAGE